jgi:D-beta-D-heptose 7-phosphate kinase/D-beta-D-heptose 1-phosphate adenosyltransferase
MLDVYLRGDVDRISPEAPVPVVRVREKELALGGAANVAQNVVAIGANCTLVCAVGEDAEGQVVKEMLREIGADSRSIVTVRRRTTTKTRILARSQQIVRFDEEEDADIQGVEVERLLAAAIDAIDAADALVLEDYNKGVLTPALITPLMQHAKSREMVAAEQVSKLVLVPEPLIPVGVKEKVVSAGSRPPRLLEVVIEVGIPADERAAHARAHGFQLI